MQNPFEQLNERLHNIENMLMELQRDNNIKTSKTDDSVWFSLKELREYLPSKPAASTVYGWVGNRQIPFIRRGKKLIFNKAEIDQWLTDGRVKTVNEINS